MKDKYEVGDVVEVCALDLMLYSGSGDLSSEGLLPVRIFGKVLIADKEKICIAMAETMEWGHGESNFDERMYIPIGCVLEVNVLKQKGRKNGKANHSNK